MFGTLAKSYKKTTIGIQKVLRMITFDYLLIMLHTGSNILDICCDYVKCLRNVHMITLRNET